MIFSRSYIKIFFLLIFFQLGCYSISRSQIFGNEWIKPNQTYYKIPVLKTGLYGISFSQLRNSGIQVAPSGSVQPKELQIFYRGVEQAIWTNNDSLFFYGKRNDGTLDSLLYQPNSAQPHKYFNLYSDTSAYFLTWASGQNGKRMNIPSITSNNSPESFHWDETLQVFNTNYDIGFRYSVETYMTYGDQGEGWFGETISNSGGAPVNGSAINFPIKNVFTGGPSEASLEVMVVGRNGLNYFENIHNINILVSNGVQADLVFAMPGFAYHEVKKFNIQVPVSFLTTSNLTVKLQNLGSGTSVNSVVSPAYAKFRYPQTYDMGTATQKYFNLPVGSSATSLSISNCLTDTKLYDITDNNNIQFINAPIQTGNLVTPIQLNATGNKLFAVSSASILSINTLFQVSMSGYSNVATADFILISHTKLISGARDFAKYRASIQGGHNDTLVADVNKLYNLFSYGERSPVAIRRFMEYLTDKGDPKYLFIIGKGLIIDYAKFGVYYRFDPLYHINHPTVDYRREDLVPTFGSPGSDLLYVTGLKGKDSEIPAIPVGRLSVWTLGDVNNYLQKVIQHESAPDSLWRKNLLHLSGGHPNEAQEFLDHVNRLKLIAEDTIFGGKVVQTISKKGSESVDNQMIGNVAAVLNNGVSYMTFFGHSAPNVTDLDIGFASLDYYDYRNKGKYPLLFINGCSSAQMFSFYSFAEDWVKTADRGAILSLGHTDQGYVSELMDYSTFFYRNAFTKRSMAGKSVGEMQLATIDDLYNSRGKNLYDVLTSTIHQMVLQGDPSLKIYTPVKPDYETNDDVVSIKSFDNRTVTAVSDSFALSFVVTNRGIQFDDSLKVLVKRTINGNVLTYGPVSFTGVKNLDTINFKIKSPNVSTYGENIFEIILDPNNEVAELNEMNNKSTLRYFMPLSGVTALLPKEYSIVSSSPVTLVGQSTNLLISPVDYYIEIDTSYLFKSPIKKNTVINAGALIRWKDVSLPYLKDSLVYYWRIRYNTIPAGEDTLWGESSFIYILNSPEGWSQSQFAQFTKDGLSQIDKNISLKKWEFSQATATVSVKTVGSNYVHTPPSVFFPNASTETFIGINGSAYSIGNYCFPNALLAVAFDRTTVKPYSPYDESKGGNLCGTPTKEIVNGFNYLFDSTSSANQPVYIQNQANFTEFLNNVQTGDYILLTTTGEANLRYLSKALKNRLKTEFGARLIDSIKTDGMPYILLAKKGGNAVSEAYGPNTVSGEITLSDTLIGLNNEGYITSTLIGPASSWGTFYHNIKPSEVPVTDEDSLMIIGVDLAGNNIDTLAISQKDSLDLTTVAGLNNYPYIRLLAKVTDYVHLTPPQLKRWQVIYSGVPEGTMNAEAFGIDSYKSVTKAEGDSIKVCYAFENISSYPFTDSIPVRFTINNSTKGIKTSTINIAPLKKDSTITFCRTVSTKGLEGSNTLQAYVNPEILREQYYNNNVLEMSFNVTKDKTHPSLDVAFDGTHIMDGDIVSPNPMITITLNDENKFLIRENKAGIDVYIQMPGASAPIKVDSSMYTGKQVGVNGKNVYRIEYNPKNLPDGKYILIVRARDVSGNLSGVNDYQISFEVTNVASISNFYPYPNPFSTSTRFVFTITGNEVPHDLKIQIMTVTGKVIREITQAEIGTIRIGNNKTDYAWDGTDEFGDKLANGVYLYRVVIKNADAYQHRNTAGDKAFKKDWGKLYILR